MKTILIFWIAFAAPTSLTVATFDDAPACEAGLVSIVKAMAADGRPAHGICLPAASEPPILTVPPGVTVAPNAGPTCRQDGDLIICNGGRAFFP